MTHPGQSDRPTIAATDRFARLLGEVKRAAGTLHEHENILALRWRRMTPTEGRFECELRSGTLIVRGVGEYPVDAIEGCLDELDRWLGRPK